MAEQTPMKKQYQELKERYPDCVMFFRLGDFYEMFDDDAKIGAKELELVLTSRNNGRNVPDAEKTPMCGVPYHSAESYIGRLVAKGYKVAICEQTEDPALAKGLVTRDVIRVITPGTLTETSMLDEARSIYISSVWLEGDAGAVCFCDVSTGETFAGDFAVNASEHIINELGRFSPSEVMLSQGASGSFALMQFITERLAALPERSGDGFELDTAQERVQKQFAARSQGLSLGEGSVRALGALLAYLERTQKFDLSYINSVESLSQGRYMELDYSAMRSLELTASLRHGGKKGSLLWVLDKTKTSMGARMLRSWVERPLLNPTDIQKRLNSVQELVSDTVMRGELTHRLGGVGDMRRLAGKAVYGTANGRDLHVLGAYCAELPELLGIAAAAHSRMLRECGRADTLADVAADIAAAIGDEPPFSVREGGMIRAGYNEEVDRLRALRDNGASMVCQLEERERERTGVKKLKVGYNRVFGYYIQIPNSATDAVIPPEYIRKQTLANGERYFTPELKQLENDLLSAGDSLCELEFQLFTDLRERVAAQVERIQATADAVSAIDCLCSLAEVAVRNSYCMPQVDYGRELVITEGRHPVVEQTQTETPFVPNDVHLNDTTDRVAIITGPNMAGKSTYMRQTALIVLMAQMGSFVPARDAHIGVVDRVFTRIGASDDLAAGQSTFMVEMSETAEILRSATSRSLLILDEIGRGTSTYDGMAIARAVLEYCADRRRLGAKTMFATHYHELSAMEGSLPGVKNYSITARKQSGKLIFLRKIVPGAADDSYGIEVAMLAGVPSSIVTRARECLRQLERAGAELETAPTEEQETEQITLEDAATEDVKRQLLAADLNSMTPLEAMNFLAELKRQVTSG
ncbi:MAG: DNA mismatch repair protein MutS [Oscillospiraceae bacterium]|nr:DNA mismatch repair protein MutS [Oscillospiraceae bacterium]